MLKILGWGRVKNLIEYYVFIHDVFGNYENFNSFMDNHFASKCLVSQHRWPDIEHQDPDTAYFSIGNLTKYNETYCSSDSLTSFVLYVTVPQITSDEFESRSSDFMSLSTTSVKSE